MPRLRAPVAVPPCHAGMAFRDPPRAYGPADLGWGPASSPIDIRMRGLEDGRAFAGAYRLEVIGQDLAPGRPLPRLVLTPEPRGVPRAAGLDQAGGGWTGSFEVVAGEKAVTLALHRGGPLVLHQLRVEASTFSDERGLNDRRERPR